MGPGKVVAKKKRPLSTAEILQQIRSGTVQAPQKSVEPLAAAGAGKMRLKDMPSFGKRNGASGPAPASKPAADNKASGAAGDAPVAKEPAGAALGGDRRPAAAAWDSMPQPAGRSPDATWASRSTQGAAPKSENPFSVAARETKRAQGFAARDPAPEKAVSAPRAAGFNAAPASARDGSLLGRPLHTTAVSHERPSLSKSSASQSSNSAAVNVSKANTYPTGPKAAQHPTAPQHPKASQYPNAPQNGGLWQNPNAPQYPNAPQRPNTLQNPGLWQNPKAPQRPNTLQKPGLWQNPRAPQRPRTLQNPKDTNGFKSLKKSQAPPRPKTPTVLQLAEIAQDDDDTEPNSVYPGFSAALTRYVEEVYDSTAYDAATLDRVEAFLKDLFLAAQHRGMSRKQRFWEALPFPSWATAPRQSANTLAMPLEDLLRPDEGQQWPDLEQSAHKAEPRPDLEQSGQDLRRPWEDSPEDSPEPTQESLDSPPSKSESRQQGSESRQLAFESRQPWRDSQQSRHDSQHQRSDSRQPWQSSSQQLQSSSRQRQSSQQQWQSPPQQWQDPRRQRSDSQNSSHSSMQQRSDSPQQWPNPTQSRPDSRQARVYAQQQWHAPPQMPFIGNQQLQATPQMPFSVQQQLQATPQLPFNKQQQRQEAPLRQLQNLPRPETPPTALAPKLVPRRQPNELKAQQLQTRTPQPTTPLKRRKLDSSNAADDDSIEEDARKQRRALRFAEMQAQDEAARAEKAALRRHAVQAQAAARARGAEGNPDVLEWDAHTIVGSSQTLEKAYLRLTAPPDPSTVRPLAVLERAFDLLRQKWREEHNYTYICDQFKSLRQDLTVQRLASAFTVRVYEAHARIALEMGDLGEYNQCQSQLRQLYARGLPGCTDEFCAYRVLYFCHTRNAAELCALAAQATRQPGGPGPHTRFALQVHRAVAQGDYHSLFALYVQPTPIMTSYLIDQFCDRERLRALRAMCRAYRPSLSAALVAEELGFFVWRPVESEQLVRQTLAGGPVDDARIARDLAAVRAVLHSQAVAACIAWLDQQGTVWVDATVSDDDRAIDSKQSLGVFASRYTAALGKVDIKGQVH